MNSVKKISLGFLLLAVVALWSSCKKDSNSPGPGSSAGYPKEVTIEYRVSSSSGLTEYYHISFDNETGGDTDLWDGTLPFSKVMKQTVKQGDSYYLYVSAQSDDDGSVTTEILVDGKVVATNTHTSNSGPSGSVSYYFE